MSFIGNAGEYFVLAELTRKGIIAGLTPRNTQNFDILATNNGKNYHIRVKSSKDGNSWMWNAKKDGTIFRGLNEINEFDIVVLVDLSKDNVEYYIVSASLIDSYLKDGFNIWKEGFKKDGEKRSDKNKVRILPSNVDFIKDGKNNWCIFS